MTAVKERRNPIAIARSISRAAYMALARRAPRKPLEFGRSRPFGWLIWGHATNAARAGALLQIVDRLRAIRGQDITLLLTVQPGMMPPFDGKEHVICHEIPEDTIPGAVQFLDHWRPDYILWTGGHLVPAFLTEADTRGIEMGFVDADTAELGAGRWRWKLDVLSDALGRFGLIMARTDEAATALRKLGVQGETQVTGALQEGGAALPCNEKEREEMVQLFAGRPIWLAAMLQSGELDIVLGAYRKASRIAHRLLLIIVPDDETQGPDFMEKIHEMGIGAAIWSEGEVPDETVQILLADTWGEMGLWYRLAPITLMGSSLVPGQGGRDPFEPAALGSAILYGPNVRDYLPAYTRFARAGAARMVKDAETLSSAVLTLVAPDQAAQMAMAGWEVASEGAEVTDRIIEAIQDRMDELEFAS